ncbi:hypothetical protein K9M48_01140 [Candidatus Gracilibacteria bacterium]|nr:hypothetical protein [Candidatus Gracilibacteria bacterium]
MENLTKTMLLTSSIKIDTEEVITKLEKNALEAINIQAFKNNWQKYKKTRVTKRWIVFGILVVLMIITDLIVWKEYLAPDQVMPQLNKILFIVFIPTIIFGLIHILIYGLFLEKEPRELKNFQDINSAFKEETQNLITETQIKIYAKVLKSIFSDLDINFEEKLKYNIESCSEKREIKDNEYSYLSRFIENDLPSYFDSFFRYKWEWIFSERTILIVEPKSIIDHKSIYIQKIFLNEDNLVCILLEGELIDSQFAGFDSEKILSKEYIKIWKG